MNGDCSPSCLLAIARIFRLHSLAWRLAFRVLGLKYAGLKRQTVSYFKLAYTKLKKSKRAEDRDITEIVKKKTGRPTLLPENLMKKVIETVAYLRLRGAPVSAAVICAVARGVIIANDRSLL